MANIEELQRALRQGSDAKARLSGLDEQYQQAQDRGVATTKKDQYGQVSPLSVLADVVGQSRSRRDMRELAPQREAARSNIAQHENAQGLFNAVRQQEQDNQIQANWTDGHALKLAQQSQSEAREVSRQKELAAEIALNAENTEYERGLTNSNFNREAYSERQKKNEDSKARQSVVELVSTTNPEDRLNVYERDGKYYDQQTDLQIDPTGYKAVQKTASKLGGSGLKPTGAERKSYLESKRLLGVISELDEMRGGLTPKELDEMDQPIAEGLADAIPFNAGKRWVEDKMYSSEGVHTYRTKVARLESKLSQLASGLAVTGYEMSDRQKWSPNAAGITDAERERRLENVNNDLFSQSQKFEQYYPDYVLDTEEAQPVSKPAGVTDAEWASISTAEQKAYIKRFGDGSEARP